MVHVFPYSEFVYWFREKDKLLRLYVNRASYSKAKEHIYPLKSINLPGLIVILAGHCATAHGIESMPHSKINTLQHTSESIGEGIK